MGHATNRRNGDLKNASWFAGSAFDFGFPHYFGPVDNRLDTNHATDNKQNKERRPKKMRVCPKCGFVDPPEWKHSKYSYWIDNIRVEDFRRLSPTLAKILEAQGFGEDEYYIYRITKNKTRIERKAKVDYGNQWTIPMEKAHSGGKHDVRDFRKVWSRGHPKQRKLLEVSQK